MLRGAASCLKGDGERAGAAQGRDKPRFDVAEPDINLNVSLSDETET
jgi:hypothetical protein